MQLVISRKELLRGLHRIQGVVEKRNAMTILSNVLLETIKGGVEMFATDLEIGIRGGYRGEVKEPGGVAVSARKLLEILRELPEKDISLAKQEGSSFLCIQCGSSQFKIAGMPPADFPKMPVVSGKELPAVPAHLLYKLLTKTIYAVGEHDTRYMLNGVYITISQVTTPSAKSILTCVGTDGHRLAVSQIDLGLARGVGELKVIIPRKAAQEIRRLLGEIEEERDQDPRLGVTENQLVFRMSDLTLTTRLIEGSYPDYEQVIPWGNDQKVSLEKAEFENAVRRVALLAPDRVNTIHCAFEPNRVVLHSSTSDLGEAKDELKAGFDGEGFESVFNARYLLDALGNIDGDQVVLELKDSASPCLIREAGPVRTTCVVMPMKV